MDADPTPGDPEQLDRMLDDQWLLVELAREIDEGLTALQRTTDGVFIGETADALRDMIDKRLRNYIGTFRDAHEKAHTALRAYASVMVEQQRVADGALSAAEGLEEDDPQRETHRSTAETARGELASAASTAGDALSDAAGSIASPIDPCEEFWKFLTILAIILIVPAIIVGGPLALLALGLNVALLIKTAIDFANGDAGVTELVLGVLGVIMPTTKGLNVGRLGSSLWGGARNAFSGIRTFGSGGISILDDLFRAGGNSRFLLTFGYQWVRSGNGLFRMAPVVVNPSMLRNVTTLGAVNIIGARTFVLLQGAVGAVRGFGNAMRGFGGFVVMNLRGWGPLSLVLPVAATEMGAGIGTALRIGLIDRGVFGLYRYGANVGGRGIGAAGQTFGGVADAIRLGSGIGDGGIGVPRFTGAVNALVPPLPPPALASLPPASVTGLGMSTLPPIGVRLGEQGLSGLPDIPTFSSGVLRPDLSTPNLAAPVVPGGGLSSLPPPVSFGGGEILTVPPGGRGAFQLADLPPLSVGLGARGADWTGVGIPQFGAVVSVPPVGAGANGFEVSLGSLPPIGVSFGERGLTGAVQGVTAPSPGALLPDLAALPPAGGRLTPGTGVMPGVVPGGATVPGNVSLGSLFPNGLDVRVGDMPSVHVDFARTGGVAPGTVTPNGGLGAPQGSALDLPQLESPAAVLPPPAVTTAALPGDLGTVTLSREALTIEVGGIPPLRVGLAENGAGDVLSSAAVPSAGARHPDVTLTGGLDAPAPVAVPPPGAALQANGLGQAPPPAVAVPPARVEVAPVTGGSGAGSGGAAVTSQGVQPIDVAALAVPPQTVTPAAASQASRGLAVPPESVAQAVPQPKVPHVPSSASVSPADIGGPLPKWLTDGLGGLPPVPPQELTVFMVRQVEYTGTPPVPTASTAANTPAPAVAPQLPPRTAEFGIPADGAPALRGTFDGGSGQLVEVDFAAPPANGAFTVERTGDLVRIDQDLGGGVTRSFTYQAAVNDLHLVFTQRWVTLPGDAWGGARLRFDETLPEDGPRLVRDGAAVPDAVTPAGGGFHVALGDTRALTDGAGTLTHTGVPLRGMDGRPGGDWAFTPVEGATGVSLRGVDGQPAPGVLTFDAGTLSVTRGDTVSAYRPTGELLTQTHHIRTGPLGGHHLEVPNTTAVPGAEPRLLNPDHTPGGVRVVAQTDGSFRVAVDGAHVVLDDAGRQLGEVVPLRTRGGDEVGVFLGRPGMPGPELRDALGAPAVAQRAGGEIVVVRGDTTHVYGVDGALLREAHLVRGGAFDGQRLVVPNDGAAPHLAGAGGDPLAVRVVAQTDGSFRVAVDGAHAVLDDAGRQLGEVVPLRTRAGADTGVFAARPGMPGPEFRDALGAPAVAQRAGAEIHVVRGGTTHVYDAQGALLREEFTFGAGPLTGHRLVVPDDPTAAFALAPGGARLPDGHVVPQTGGGFRVATGTTHALVDDAGRWTATAVPLREGAQGLDTYAVRPVANPAHTDFRTGTGAPAAAGWGTEGTRLTFTQGPVTRVHAPDGALAETRLALTGGPLDGSRVVTPYGGGAPHVTSGTGAPRTADVTPQAGGGFRVDGQGSHVVIDAGGVYRHDVVPLTRGGGTDGYAFVSHFRPDPLPRAADGTPLPGGSLARLDDNRLVVRAPGSVTAYDAGGAFLFDAPRFPGRGLDGDEFLRTHTLTQDGRTLRAHDLLDADLRPVPDTVVRPRPGAGDTGLAVTGPEGRVWLHGPDGALTGSIGAADPVTGARPAVRNGQHLTLVELSDGLGARYLDTTAPNQLRLLDGNLDVVASHGPIRVRGDGLPGHEIGGQGLRAGEYSRYTPEGRLVEQRIDVLYKGVALDGRHFVVRYGPDGSGTWEAAGGAGIRGWHESGTVDLKGAGQGRVSLVTHTGGQVLDRRLLPDGHTVDYHAPGNAGDVVNRTFGMPNGLREKDFWSETDALGAAAGHGYRQWNVSGRGWFDVRDHTFLGDAARNIREGTPLRWSNEVRHVRENPDGGYVVGTVDSRASVWHRYDGDFRHVADGTRTWGPGSSWTDTMPDPRTGQTQTVHRKFPPFTLSDLDNLRHYRAHGLAPDGTWTDAWTGIAPTGKEVGSSRALPDGDTLTVERVAEQRPPSFMRSALSAEYRHTDLGQGGGLRGLFGGRQGDGALGGLADVARPSWVRHNDMQLFEWHRGNGTSGIRVVSQHTMATTDFATNGAMVGATRKLHGGQDLAVGNTVALPPGTRDLGPRHLPFSEGTDGLKGHRTFRPREFDDLPPGTGYTQDRVVWQDRYTTDLADGDWYTPQPGKPWHTTRVGLDDGSVLEFRQPPGARPGPLPDGGLDFRRVPHAGDGADWTLFDYHGKVLARMDTWPDGTRVLGRGNEWSVPGTDLRGTRLTAERNELHHRGWDRHSYQDIGPGGIPVRDSRLLGDGTTVTAWRTELPDGGGVRWNWNKMERDGEIREFGQQADRVRRWYDPSTGALQNDWRAGARFADELDNTGPQPVRVQEIPARPQSGPVRDLLSENPWRVREYAATPGDIQVRADLYRTWAEYDAGVKVRGMDRLPDGTYLERETWQQQWRRYAYGDGDGAPTVIAERSIPGFVWERGTFGQLTLTGRENTFLGFRPDFHLTGRETHFSSISNDLRGYTRELREPLRWSWGPAVGGESTYTPFVGNALGQVAVEGLQEFTLDFLLSMAVYGIVAAATGTPFTPTDVAQAAVGAAISSGVKSVSSFGHAWAAHRTAFRVGLSNTDMGYAYNFRQNDDSWASEWAGNEKVLRWRGGTYDFFKDGVVGALGGFAGQATAAAAFGVKDSEGNRHDVTGGQAALYGLAGAVGGALGNASIGALRGMLQNTAAGRFYHRQGMIDFLLMPSIGKLIDKSAAAFWIGPMVRDWLNITPPAPTPPPPPPPSEGTRP